MKNPTLPNVLHICFKVKNYAKQLLESFKIWVFFKYGNYENNYTTYKKGHIMFICE